MGQRLAATGVKSNYKDYFGDPTVYRDETADAATSCDEGDEFCAVDCWHGRKKSPAKANFGSWFNTDEKPCPNSDYPACSPKKGRTWRRPVESAATTTTTERPMYRSKTTSCWPRASQQRRIASR